MTDRPNQIPPGGFRIVYADPPWPYRDKCHAGKRGAIYKYPSMTIEEICAVPVKHIVADDAVLFLWVTWPFIFKAERVMEAWGFEYMTLGFDWAKTNPKAGTPFFGMGSMTRSCTEPCLLAKRGKPKRVDAGVHSYTEAKRREHSQKPIKVRDKIVRLLGDVPRIELFARCSAPGWHLWGDQAKGYSDYIDIEQAVADLATKKGGA